MDIRAFYIAAISKSLQEHSINFFVDGSSIYENTNLYDCLLQLLKENEDVMKKIPSPLMEYSAEDEVIIIKKHVQPRSSTSEAQTLMEPNPIQSRVSEIATEKEARDTTEGVDISAFYTEEEIERLRNRSKRQKKTKPNKPQKFLNDGLNEGVDIPASYTSGEINRLHKRAKQTKQNKTTEKRLLHFTSELVTDRRLTVSQYSLRVKCELWTGEKLLILDTGSDISMGPLKEVVALGQALNNKFLLLDNVDVEFHPVAQNKIVAIYVNTQIAIDGVFQGNATLGARVGWDDWVLGRQGVLNNLVFTFIGNNVQSWQGPDGTSYGPGIYFFPKALFALGPSKDKFVTKPIDPVSSSDEDSDD